MMMERGRISARGASPYFKSRVTTKQPDMERREFAQRINIQNRVTGAMAPPMYFYANYEEAKKKAEKLNTLLVRFPEKWMAW